MNISIIGYRKFYDYELFVECINKKIKRDKIKIKNIISGGCLGTDKLAEKYADENKINKIIYYPNIKKFGSPKAYHIRNKEIADNCDILFAFVDKESKGSLSTINFAKNSERCKKIFIFNLI